MRKILIKEKECIILLRMLQKFIFKNFDRKIQWEKNLIKEKRVQFVFIPPRDNIT